MRPCTIQDRTNVASYGGTLPVASECLSFSAIPHTTKLFAGFLHDFSRVSHFYDAPKSRGRTVGSVFSWLPEEAKRIAYSDHRRAIVANILESQNRQFGASSKAMDNIQRFRSGASAAVTGQQVGFLGGPLFSFLKAIMAVRLAAEASRAGAETVPIFWLATEDHDFEEIKSAVVQDADGRLHTVSVEAELTAGAPMSSARLTDTILAEVESVSDLLGNTDVARFVRESYVPGETVGTAFAKLFARIFAEFGVILLDASDPELHRLAAPLYRDAIVHAEAIDTALAERGRELHAAGYHEQVKITESSTLVFGISNGARTPIHRANGGFELGEEKLSPGELLARIDEHPEQFSANVLLRPVVQDFLLPTLVYTGGPAEVAYFAQAAVVYERLLGRVTPVVPRFSATLVDSRAQRLLTKYRLSVSDLFHGPEYTRELIAERSLPSDLQKCFEEATRSVEEALTKLGPPLETLDPTLVEAASRAASKIRYQLTRLRTRAANAEIRRSEIVSRHAEHLSSALFPHKQMQERVITGVSFLARYGLTLLDTLYESTQRGCPEHQVIYLQ
jgi:bacillithiol biosynthesis cysteine-adding enzyme BshC